MFRKKLSRGSSAKNFKAGNRVNSKNYATAMRGGYRL